MGKENCSNKMQESVKLFREKYPEGKISVNVSQNNGCVMARARIYPKYNEEERCFLSEITIAKAINDSNTFETLISETQCEAVSLAIQTACSFGGNQSVVVTDTSKKEEIVESDEYQVEEKVPETLKEKELTYEEKYKKALAMACPIAKYKEKNYTLGQVLGCDPKAIKWLAEKFTGDTEIKEAAQLICDYAVRECA